MLCRASRSRSRVFQLTMAIDRTTVSGSGDAGLFTQQWSSSVAGAGYTHTHDTTLSTAFSGYRRHAGGRGRGDERPDARHLTASAGAGVRAGGLHGPEPTCRAVGGGADR